MNQNVQEDQVSRALAAATATASAFGFDARNAAVLSNSNRIVARLLPCDTLVRVAPGPDDESAALELEIARRLASVDGPIAGPDPRVPPHVFERDGFTLTFWTYFEPLAGTRFEPSEYAAALRRLHEAMTGIDMPTPHFTDRVMEAQRIVEDPANSPALSADYRDLLSNTLRTATDSIIRGGQGEQVLHGEPHAGNLLRTRRGLLFIDLQTCCRGPVEFDIAHCSQPADAGATWHFDAHTPAEIAPRYAGADPELVRECCRLMLAMVAAWRADRRDQFPDGASMLDRFLREIREFSGRGDLRV